MDSATLQKKLVSLYPVFEDMKPDLLEYVLQHGQLHVVPAGTVLFDENSPCQAFPLLLEGVIRVCKVGASGREIQLYRVVPGEACVLSSSCMLATAPYNARGTTESETTVFVLPPPLFNRLLSEHEPFRTYVFGLFADRIADLIQLVEAIAFHKLDQRLAALLLGKGKVIHTTHQNLADELGSVREMVSRLLKSFAEQGLVSLGREQIEIVDPSRLRRLAAV